MNIKASQNTPEHHQIILESPTCEKVMELKERTSQNTTDILNLPVDIDTNYEYLIGDEVILEILRKKPTLWLDIQQKIKKFTNSSENKDNPGREQELTESIMAAFLIPEQDSVGISREDFQVCITNGIMHNKKLFDYVKRRTPVSFMEYSTHRLAQFKNAGSTKQLLIKIIRRNTGKEGDELIVFNKIFRQIISYIKSIFGVDIELSLTGFQGKKIFENIDEPAQILYEGLSAQIGRSQRDAALLLRSLYAWGNLEAIHGAQKIAKRAQPRLFDALKKVGGYRELEETELLNSDREQQRGIEFHIPIPHLSSYPVIIESGVKSIRSILIKLYADEEYNNIDAMNDLLGVREMLEYMPTEHHAEAIAWATRFFGKDAFIFKNKNLLRNVKSLDSFWAKGGKPPFTIKSKISHRSSRAYKDCKYSGHLDRSISENPVNAEWQFFQNREDPSPTGEAHHTILNAGKIIQGWVRGEHMITAKQILVIINDECRDHQTGVFPSGLGAKEIFWSLLKKQFLVPYTFGNKNNRIVIFGVRGFEHLLKKDYPTAKKQNIYKHGDKSLPVPSLVNYIDAMYSELSM